MTPNEYLHSKITEQIKAFPDEYALVEIGVDRGTTAMWTMQALNECHSKKWFFTVDPHGDKPYRIDRAEFTQYEYGDHKYRDAAFKCAEFAMKFDINHAYWKMKSLDFIKILPQIEFWSAGEPRTDWKFCYAMLDGEHSWDTVLQEFEWFYERMDKGGLIVVDDYNIMGADPEHVLSPYKGTVKLESNDEHYRVYFTKD